MKLLFAIVCVDCAKILPLEISPTPGDYSWIKSGVRVSASFQIFSVFKVSKIFQKTFIAFHQTFFTPGSRSPTVLVFSNEISWRNSAGVTLVCALITSAYQEFATFGQYFAISRK